MSCVAFQMYGKRKKRVSEAKQRRGERGITISRKVFQLNGECFIRY